MIYLVSDLHGGQDTDGFCEYVSSCTENDILIILGDVELGFQNTEEVKRFTAYFESLTCNIAFIDGNHENFDYLYSFPEEEWNGGRVHRISDNIVHLMRGYVFEIQGKSFLTMGGCKSSQKWIDAGLWWKQEVPTSDEIERAYCSLAKHEGRVDYVLTHKYPHEKPVSADPLTLEGFWNYVDENVDFHHWYAGHWHKEISFDEKHTAIFDKLIKL